MDRRLSLLLIAAAGCSGDEDAPFDLPDLGTSYAVFGTASAGQALLPRDLRVLDVARDTVGLRPDLVAGGDIDVVWAGLDPAALPAGTTPESLLPFVRIDADGTRGLPPLSNPHVLRAPSSAGAPDPLVPIADDSVLGSVAADRAERYEVMLSQIGIQRPCRPPSADWTVVTPRISSEAVAAARAMSDGTTALGLATTSTAQIGIIPIDSLDVTLVGVGNEPIPMATAVTVIGLDGPEVVHPQGHRVPAWVALAQPSVFSSSASVWFWAGTAWQQDSPLAGPLLPRTIIGLRSVTVDGVPSRCAIGTGQSGLRPAAIWCRPETNGDGNWTVLADFDSQLGMTALINTPDGGLLATDRKGTIYRRFQDGWTIAFESAINIDCGQTICAGFDQTATTEAEDGRPVLWLAGDDVQLLRLSTDGPTVEATVPEGLNESLFGDERASADVPASFKAVVQTPDDALWLATDRGVLLRRAPDGHIDRVCLPDAFVRNEVSALAAHPDGRLIVAGSPVTLGQTDWRWPAP